MKRKLFTLFISSIFLLFLALPYSYAQDEFDDIDLDNIELSDEEEDELMDEIDSLFEDADEGDDFVEDEEADLFGGDELFGGDDLDEEDDLIGGDELDAPVKRTSSRSKLSKEVLNKLKVKMVLIEGGCFMMGDTFGSGHHDETPVHEVCVDDFFLAETEMTQEIFEMVMGFNPSVNKGEGKPVDFVGWGDVTKFINHFNMITGEYYRLPSEAEWEYAARGGGKDMQWAGTNDEFGVDDYGWHRDNSGDTSHPVKSKKPNSLGLYGMSGNLWEWVYDYYDMNYYKDSEKDNPEGPDFSVWRGLRGGSYFDETDKLRTSARYGNTVDRRSSNVGFRLAQ